MAQDFDAGKAVFRAIADFSNLRKEAKAAARDMDDLDRSTRAVGSGSGGSHQQAGRKAGTSWITGFAKVLTKGALGSIVAGAVGGAGAAVISAVPALVQLAASLLPLAGAALPVVGVMGGMAAGAVALSMGVKTLKTRLADLAPQFTALQESVGYNFMYHAEKPIRNMVSKLMPDLKDGMENIGDAWGRVTARGADELTRMLGNGQLKYMLEETRKGVAGLEPAVAPAIHAFTFLGMAGVKYLPRLSAWITELTVKFDEWVTRITGDGSFDRWVEQAIAGLKDLWSIVESVFGIFGALNTAANAAGGTTTLGGLADALERISGIMNGPTFQKALTTIFEGANKGASALLDSLGPLGAAFERGAPALARFLELGGQILGTLITGLADALSNPAFGAGLIAFMEGVNVGMAALAPLLPVITGLLGGLLAALAPVVAALIPLSPVLVPLALAIAGIVKGFLLFQTLAPLIGILRGIGGAFAALNAIMMANPIILVIALIALLVGSLIWFFTQTEIGRQIWGGFMNWLGEVFGGFLNWWNGTVVPWFSTMFAVAQAALAGFQAVWNGIWTAVWNFIQMVISVVIGLISMWVSSIFNILNGLAVLGAMAWNWFMGMVNSAISAGGQLLSYVAGIPGQVLSFLGNLGGLLIGAGQSLIQGFIDGISSMIGAVGDAVGGVMDFIGGFFPASPAKRGAFSGSGWTPHRGKALMEGFGAGISDDGAAVAATDAAMRRVSGAFGLNPANVMKPPASELDKMTALSTAVPPPGAGTAALADKPVVSRTLNVEVNNPTPEPPSQSIQKTYSKVAYLGLDGEE